MRIPQQFRTLAGPLLIAALSFAGCGRTDLTGLGGGKVTVDPSTATVALGRTQQFTATATPAADLAWTVVGDGVGTIDATGLYTAPAAFADAGTTTLDVTVRAALATDATVFGEAIVTLIPAADGVPVKLVKQSGDLQSGIVGEQLPTPLVVQLVDSKGTGVAGVEVTFQSPAGTGAAVTVTTDDQGFAEAHPEAGTVAGRQEFPVVSSGVPTVTFGATLAPGPAAKLVASADVNEGKPGAILPSEVKVVAQDRFDNALETPALTVTSPDGAVATDLGVVNGSRRYTLKLAPVSGEQAFTFTETGGTLATDFFATAVGGPAAALRLVSGDGQSVVVNGAAPQRLVVQVVDADGFGVGGTAVAFSATGGRIDSADTVSAADGTISAGFIANTVSGAASVAARADGLTGSPVNFALQVVPGAAQSLVVVGGAGQSTTANQPFGTAFTVRASDAFGNGVAGVTVVFSVVSGGGAITPGTATTDAAGLAQAAMTAGPVGQQVYRAESVGLSGSPADVTGFAVAPAGLVLVKVSGDAQTGAAGSDLTAPLVVKVTRSGVGVAGISVQFGVADGNGSVRPATVTTAADGQAQATAKLGSLAGPQQFAATVAGATPSAVTFSATATAAGPSIFRIVSGDGQSGRTGATLAQPFVVEALRADGTPVSGLAITFAAESAGSVDPASATTDTQGRASTTATLGGTAGVQGFTATLTGLPVLRFTATAIAPSGARTLRLVSGDAQSAEVGLALAQPIVVAVVDDAGQPVANAQVSFRPEAELARVAPDTVTTGADGRAQTIATLGKPVGSQRFFVDATNADGSPANGSPLTITATGAVAPASKLVVASGDGQVGLVLSALGRPFVVAATDRVGNPKQGVPVSFAPGATGGSLNPATGTSAADGTVSTTATLGPTVGPQTFVASSSALPGVTAVFTAQGTNQVERISVTPQGQEFEVGSNRRYQAVAVFTDGTSAIVTNDATWVSSTPNVLAVSDAAGSKGVATAASPGTAAVRATYGGRTGETTATIVAATLRQVVIYPAAPELVRGSTRQFTALGTYSNNAVSDVTEAGTWSSANAAIATVSSTAGSKGLVRATGVGTTTVTITVGTVTATRQVTVTAAPVASLEVTPLNVVQPAGTSARFRATATYTDGTVEDVTNVATWDSSDTTKMTVQNAPAQAGLATFLAAGSPSVLATHQGVTARRQVTITAATVVSLVPQPNEIELALRDIFQFRLIATYSDGSVGEVAALATWSSSNTATVDVSNAAPNTGTVTAIAAGDATITARLGTQSATMRVRVSGATIVGMRVFQAGQGGGGPGGGPGGGRTSADCPAGTLLRLTAGALYSDQTLADISDQASWSSSNPAAAVVGQGATLGGVVQCLAQGTTTITAAWRGESATFTVNVTAAVLSTITVTPSTATLAVGDVRTFFADGVYTDGTRRDLTGLVTWTAGDATIVTASNAPGTRGRVTGVAAGSTTVVASLDGVTGTATVTVSGARLLVLVVSPANPTPRVRERQFTFNATAVYDDGSTADVTALSAWTSSNPTVAIVSNDTGSIGRAQLLATGNTTIQATYAGRTGSTQLSVRP